RLEARLAQVRAELRTKQQQATLDIDELRWYPQHIKHLENQITNQELRLRELAILIAAQRQALTRAVQERQLYEKHKEKSHEAWTAEQDAEEAKLIDELATIKHAREQAEGAGDVHL
ncbi:MAG TPA: flagellar FliJ family protein, partial [Candidatus Nitrosotenuis sp.]|nr:flagellar FliJ family protein [Candidatus Nitrosotenuis sp.]